MLVKKYNPQRIYQWGSLINEKHFSAISDIDIAVEGKFTAEDFFRMYGDAMELTKFSLDLVEIERIDPLHAWKLYFSGFRNSLQTVCSRINGTLICCTK